MTAAMTPATVTATAATTPAAAASPATGAIAAASPTSAADPQRDHRAHVPAPAARRAHPGAVAVGRRPIDPRSIGVGAIAPGRGVPGPAVGGLVQIDVRDA